jgi:hypothetical protein
MAAKVGSILFLVSVAGQTLKIDGGQVMHS